jgi:hypothetical protein
MFDHHRQIVQFRLPAQPDELIAVRHDGGRVSRPTRCVANLEFVPGDHPDRVSDRAAATSGPLLDSKRVKNGSLVQPANDNSPLSTADANKLLANPVAMKFVTVAARLSLCFIAYATLAPIQARPTLLALSSFEHLAAFAVLGMLFCFAYPRHVVLVYVIVLGSAVVLEFLQLLTPDRHGRIWDAIQKLAGGTMGVLSGQAIVYFKQARGWFRN